MENRKCRTCNSIKNINEYHKHNNTLRLDCKVCFRTKERIRRVNRLMLTDVNHGKRVKEIQEERENRGKQPKGYSWCYVCKKYLKNSLFSPTNLKNCGKCSTCSSEYDIQRNRKLKLIAISYKGGKCIRCGWVGHYSTFDFHHRDPYSKEFNWCIARKKSFEKIKIELDKCDLLCSNCHCFIHTKLNNDGSLNNEYIHSNDKLL